MWAEANVDRGAGWDRVIFSAEKNFNLDGPDGLNITEETSVRKRTYFQGGKMEVALS